MTATFELNDEMLVVLDTPDDNMISSIVFRAPTPEDLEAENDQQDAD